MRFLRSRLLLSIVLFSILVMVLSSQPANGKKVLSSKLQKALKSKAKSGKSAKAGAKAKVKLSYQEVHEFLASHNAARAKKGVRGLSWSNDLAATAQGWANNCQWRHSHIPHKGENLAAFSASTTTTTVTTSHGSKSVVHYNTRVNVPHLVNMWVNEEKFYNCHSNQCHGGVCGHYTQLMWEGSTHVGCGYAICNSNSPFSSNEKLQTWIFAVCHYDPPGNFVGQRPFPANRC